MNRFRIEQFLELLEEPEVQEKMRAIFSDSETVKVPSLPDGRKGFGVSTEHTQIHREEISPTNTHEPSSETTTESESTTEPTTEGEWEGMYLHLQEEHQKLLTRNTRLEQELTQALRQSKIRLTEIGKLKGELAQSQELMDIREGQMVDLSGMLEEAQATLLVYGAKLKKELASEQEEKSETK